MEYRLGVARKIAEAAPEDPKAKTALEKHCLGAITEILTCLRRSKSPGDLISMVIKASSDAETVTRAVNAMDFKYAFQHPDELALAVAKCGFAALESK